MKHYLTAFIFQGYGDGDKTKIIEIYNSLEAAEEKLVKIVKEKKSEGWKIEAMPEDELNDNTHNILRMVTGEMPGTINSVTWTLTTDPVPISDGSELFPDSVDITSSVQSQARLDKMATMSKGGSFIFALIETFKLYPVASLGVSFFIIWLLFL